MNEMLLSEYEWDALILSLQVSTIAVVLSIPFGIAISWLFCRKNFYGKQLLEILVNVPLVLPPVVVGYILLIAFGRQGLIGSSLYDLFGITLIFRWQGAVIAGAVVSFPLMVRAMQQSLNAVDTKLEIAAQTLGASPWRVFRTITVPLMTPGIISGSILAFARCLGEFGATITFVSNIPKETQTIPLAMYSLIETPGAEGEAFRLCVLSIILAMTAIFISEWFIQRNNRKFNS
jgi:molybdate transport system permease protein